MNAHLLACPELATPTPRVEARHQLVIRCEIEQTWAELLSTDGDRASCRRFRRKIAGLGLCLIGMHISGPRALLAVRLLGWSRRSSPPRSSRRSSRLRGASDPRRGARSSRVVAGLRWPSSLPMIGSPARLPRRRSRRMPQVVNAQALEARCRRHRGPGLLEVGAGRSSSSPGEIRVALNAWQSGQDRSAAAER